MMGTYGIWMFLTSLISAVMGGGLVQLFNIRAKKRQAKAEAKNAEAIAQNTEAIAESQEIKNVKEAILIYKDMAFDFKKELAEERSLRNELANTVNQLKIEVKKLNCSQKRIIELLDKITHENLEKMVAVIKNELTQKNDEEISSKDLESH